LNECLEQACYAKNLPAIAVLANENTFACQLQVSELYSFDVDDPRYISFILSHHVFGRMSDNEKAIFVALVMENGTNPHTLDLLWDLKFPFDGDILLNCQSVTASSTTLVHGLLSEPPSSVSMTKRFLTLIGACNLSSKVRTFLLERQDEPLRSWVLAEFLGTR